MAPRPTNRNKTAGGPRNIRRDSPDAGPFLRPYRTRKASNDWEVDDDSTHDPMGGGPAGRQPHRLVRHASGGLARAAPASCRAQPHHPPGRDPLAVGRACRWQARPPGRTGDSVIALGMRRRPAALGRRGVVAGVPTSAAPVEGKDPGQHAGEDGHREEAEHVTSSRRVGRRVDGAPATSERMHDCNW